MMYKLFIINWVQYQFALYMMDALVFKTVKALHHSFILHSIITIIIKTSTELSIAYSF